MCIVCPITHNNIHEHNNIYMDGTLILGSEHYSVDDIDNLENKYIFNYGE